MDEENQNAELLRKLSYDALYISHLSFECRRQNILRDECSRLCVDYLKIIGRLVPLFKELEKIREQISEKTVYALRMFEEALDRAKNLAQLMRCGCKLYMELNRKEINKEFENTSSLLRRAFDYFSHGELYIPDALWKVKGSLEYFQELIRMFDAALDLKLFVDMSCVYNQSNDVATDDGTLSKLCRKLHFYGVEDIKRESQVLKKVMDMKKVMNIPGDGNLEESENKMSVLLEKLENFLEFQTVPNYFCCPISHGLMRDPVITCTEQTFERAFIEKWLNEGNTNCPVTKENIAGTSLTSNRALQSFLSGWDDTNWNEPFQELDKSVRKLTINQVKQVICTGVPKEFLCCLSERRQPGNHQKSTRAMKDPVIICTGKTYERASIEKWLKAGHKRCPSAEEFLSITSLTLNRALRSLISDWHKVNGLKLLEQSSSSNQGMVVSTDNAEGVGHDTLLSKLTSDKSEDRRSAAGELYYLHEDSYSILIPRLVGLLFSPDTVTQNDGIAILLKLSLGVWDSRHCIISSNAVPGILYVLENGSMKARGDAAHTFWSLSTLNEYRETLGASGGIPALVKLSRDGGCWEKRASARALSELCKYEGNQGLAISAGVVSMLLGELKEYSRSMEDELVSGRRSPYGPICDEALDVMKLLVSRPDGKAAIRDCRPVPVLLLLLIIGSPRNKEIVLAILSQMQSHLALDVPHLPQAKELKQILLDLNRDDDITSDEAERDFKTLLFPFIPGIRKVLENGSMEARGGAALTFWSLSTVNDEYRETLGASGGIPALVKLLRDGGPRQKTASALALSELCKYKGNQGLAISAGVVSMLLGELTKYSRSMKDRLVSGRPPPYGPICDQALDVMKLLVSHPNGKAAIRDCRPVPVLLLLLIIGSPRNKEIVLTILSQMQSDLDLNDRHLPQAEELRQILMDLNRDDDITSDEAERDFKTLLSPSIPGIVDVLDNGSMEARGGATLAFWSLSTLNDESRKTLGESGAIPALVKLVRDGGPQQKTASAGALSELCKYKENQCLAISAGVVSMLFGELREYSRSMESGRTPPYGPICDKALDVMKLLVSHPNGKAAIRDCRPVPVLLSLLKIGSPRNKEIVLAILRQMQFDLDLIGSHLPQARELGQILMDLRGDGITSDEARRDLKTLLVDTI